MTLTITQNKETKEILVCFGKDILNISENSTNWSSEGINNFLINLATKTPDGEKITIEYNKENEDLIFNHITLLFNEFVNEYNKNI